MQTFHTQSRIHKNADPSKTYRKTDDFFKMRDIDFVAQNKKAIATY
jgi:hypothetical protein